MKNTMILSFALLTGFIVIPQISEAQQTNAVQQTFYGRPLRLNNLSNLESLEANDLAASQKTEVLLSWLAAERGNPSPAITGHGGGQIDTDYIQAQITKTLETQGDPLAMSWVASSSLLKDPDIRDNMQIVLGFMGDAGQVTALEHILLNNKNPYLRAMAAEDLGLLGSTSSLPVLKAVRKDNFGLTFASEQNGGKMTTFYPVRQVVEETIRILSTPSLLAQQKMRGQLFAGRLASARKYAATHMLSQSHFVRIANRSTTRVKRLPGA